MVVDCCLLTVFVVVVVGFRWLLCWLVVDGCCCWLLMVVGCSCLFLVVDGWIRLLAT